MVNLERRLLWHPRLDDRFLVGGSGQLSLYEWNATSAEIKHITSKHDLQMMKCFAWSPETNYDDFVAIGHTHGKVDLFRLEAVNSGPNHTLSSGPSVTLPVRNSRACNTLAFCPKDPSYLAVGLDKVRGDSSLVIWDIHTAIPSLSIPISGSNTGTVTIVPPRPHPHIPRTDNGPRSDPRILQLHASAEIISTVSWLPNSTTSLLAGVSYRWLRLYDLRSSTPTQPPNIPYKVHGIAVDPLDPHRFSTFGDANIHIWDIRRLTHPVLMFNEKDASADGGRWRPNSSICQVEFSSTRRGTLASLEKDSTHVRFWDIQQLDGTAISLDGRISRDSSQSKGRLSWTGLPWSQASQLNTPTPAVEPSRASYHLLLSNTRKTKNFSRPIGSFSLVPSAEKHPLTSKIMVVNKEGDLELYALHDTPTHTPWSPRGDLAMGIGACYRFIPGFQDRTTPPEPWDLSIHPSAPIATPLSIDKSLHHDQDRRSITPAPMFGRGDEDGFPALTTLGSAPKANLAATRPGGGKAFSPGILRNMVFEHTSSAKRPSSYAPGDASLPRFNTGSVKAKGGHSRKHKETTIKTIDISIKSGVESDISMIMRKRVIQGYGLSSSLHNSAIIRDSPHEDIPLSELWLWIHHAHQILSIPTAQIEGYDFSYQGIWGVWEGCRPVKAQFSAQPTPRIAQRGLLLDAPLPNPTVTLFDSKRARSDTRQDRRRHSRQRTDPVQNDFLTAIDILNDRRDSGFSSWKPSVHTNKLAQRQLALHLCGWSLVDEDLAKAIKRWEKENRHSQAACWLVFTRQYKAAVELLMRSKDESHHMMSGMLAALIPSISGGVTKSNELREHCELLIVRLQDPYLRAMLTQLTVNDDWTEVLEEDALPLRERFAIALQFLSDLQVTAYLRRIMDQCSHSGDIEGLLITGITSEGMDVLQSYVDTTGDVQTATIVACLNPARAHDKRFERWLDSYRDLLDRWKLHHYRCQLDIDRGQILTEAIHQGAITPFEWAPRQIVIRCNYCNKSFTPPWPQNARATACLHCNRPLPRCSICLMTLSIVQDNARALDLANSGSKDTIDEALVFCQSCRHGGHASHVLEWFYGEDGSRSHGTCPVANCDCRCADAF